MVMDNKFPGVQVIEKALLPGPASPRTAVPLFIGYAATGPHLSLQAVASLVEFESLFGGPPPPPAMESDRHSVLHHAVRHYFDAGGRGAFVMALGDFSRIATLTGDEVAAAVADPRVASAVAKEPLITLVAMPDLVLLGDSDIAAWQSAWQALLRICTSRAGLFALLDAPDEPRAVVECVGSFDRDLGEWGAVYWPRLMGTGLVAIPPSAAVAACVEWVDGRLGVWAAPANVPLVNVIAPTRSSEALEIEWMSEEPLINVIKAFPGRGTRIWGCRTLARHERVSRRFVQVRRLLSYVELNIRQLVRLYVFEPNGEITWFKVKGQVSNWLRELWLRGGLQGADESEAFEVFVGLGETMTEAEIAQGQMVLRIRMGALHPAEFIELSLRFDMSFGDLPESMPVES